MYLSKHDQEYWNTVETCLLRICNSIQPGQHKQVAILQKIVLKFHSLCVYCDCVLS
jgi:hypothetical protein